jgi:hypothetical protein
MHFDLVYLAMLNAVRAFGDQGDKIFNGACFSHAFCKLAGVEGPLDGHIVRAILCGRQDAEILSGGSHYRLIETKP